MRSGCEGHTIAFARGSVIGDSASNSNTDDDDADVGCRLCFASDHSVGGYLGIIDIDRLNGTAINHMLLRCCNYAKATFTLPAGKLIVESDDP